MKNLHKVEKISITLPSEMLLTIKDKVKSGLYSSTSEVIREAMRLWQKKEEEHEIRLTAIRERLEHSANSGPAMPIEDVFQRLENKHHKTIGVSRDEDI